MTPDLWVRAANSPLLFVTDVLGATPEPWQERALNAIVAHDRVAVRSGHGVGKTALESWVILWWALTHIPFRVPVVANSLDQLKDVVWPELKMWASKLPEFLRGQLEITSDHLYLAKFQEEGFAVARVGNKDNPEALQGFHSENMLFILEEASGIPDKVFEVGMGALSTPGSKVLMCGNPTRLSGFFHAAFNKSAERWHRIHVSSEDVPRATGHIQDIIDEYGRDGNEYRVRVLGEFPTTEDEQVVPRHLVDAAVDRDVDMSLVYKPVWGLDVARFGSDRTALAKRRGNYLMEPIKSWKKKSTMEVAGIVKNEWLECPHQDRPSEILVDSVGLGAGVVDRLLELGLPARGVNVGESPAIKEKYMRLRDELWYRCRDWFEGLDVKIPDDPVLITELTAPMYTYSSSGKVQVEPKTETKKRTRRSPDLADAFVLTFAGGLEQAEEYVPVDKYTRYRPKRYRSNYGSWMAF